jgi:predicted DNA-binding WGR domain protein
MNEGISEGMSEDMRGGVQNTTATRTLRDLVAAQAGMPLPTDDVVRLLVPLFRQVAALHEEGKVAALDADDVVLEDTGELRLRRPEGTAPRRAMEALARIQPQHASNLNIIGALERHRPDDGIPQEDDLALQLDASAAITRPVYLPGFASWERRAGHHDEITDVFGLGMILAALACGLDFAGEEDLRLFVAQRRNLFAVHERLHPILAALVVEMTEVNRHGRATDVAALATRLATWRDQPPALDVERALAGKTGASPRRAGVLTHLRDRLFDLSRRNRLLFFRPTAATVNLTVASVPLVLQLESIRADAICTWGGTFAKDLVAGKPVALQQWLRFDDQPWLVPALDQILSETRRDRAEFGFSNLRLVVAFLRWHNLKEDPDERIVTPLLWLPVELVKRKGVRDQYVLQCGDGDAEFNPVLRHRLSQLYDIRLPDKVDLETTTLAEVHADLLAQIRRTEPAVELRLVDKPAIRLVRQKAMQRMQQYQRRKLALPARTVAAGLPPFSYARDDWRPLGRALFERWVRPSPLPQRFEAGAPPLAAARRPQMAEDLAEREGYVLEESEGHRYAWDLDLTQVTLANFNYKKMSLVRDYTQLLETPEANPAFDRVFSIEPRAVDTEAPPPIPTAERWNVVASDATQNAAVSLARSARSFIIQGPPGTGKSQTITNLIADYAGRGKRVLFVCEKRAALDVVFSRLRQSGLDPLCCLIHDSQTDKKAFIADLKACYEGWIAQPHDGDALRAQRAALVAQLDTHQDRIDAFEAALAAAPAALGTSVRALLRRVAALPAPPPATPAVRERLPALSAWDAQRELAARVHRAVRERTGLHSLAAHPFARLVAGLVADAAAYARVERLCAEAEALFEQLESVFEASGSLLAPELPFERALAVTRDAARLLGTGLAARLDLLDPGSPGLVRMQRGQAGLEAQAAQLAVAQNANANWRDKLTPADTGTALALASELEPSLMRWLQPRWWRLRGELARRYDFGKHAVRPSYRQVLEALAAEHAAADALAAAELASRKRYGVDDMAGFFDAVQELGAGLRAGSGPQALVASLRQAADPVALARSQAGAAHALGRLSALAGEALDLDPETPLGDIAELLRDLRESLDDLPDLLPLLRAVHGADPACAAALLRLDHTPEELDALVAGEALVRIERTSPVLQSFGGVALAQAARALAAGQRSLLALNAEVVRAAQHGLFAGHVRLSALSASQLDAEGKAFKKRYAAGRRELEHEFGKTMRHRSIRELSSGEPGAVIQDLKPIWLMSPLSVSDTLPLDGSLFDVVIFDEASQIPVEESVPALSRARQVVVVGDEMQLPPTSFFASSADADGGEIVVEEEGERIAIHLDSDSLLSQAARNLPATLLAWHYRSRHEALISFSNAAFYDGRLVTIPDQAIEQPGAEAPSLRSDAEDVGVAAADALLARPISFHRIEDGVYADRRNPAEARYIARMVRELLRRETPLSLGIVAFSEAQQGAIETALEALATEDTDFAARLEREYVREEDEQFNGLFVKNLENVQGDERDVIILSICYAPGADGKMLMNFGPINQRGGEKRLNVIFSRARHRMAVVSTIAAEAITNVHNDGAAALRAFLQFAKASAEGEFARAQSVLGALNQGAREAFTRQAASDSIRDALAQALRARGHEVHVNVGRSQLRCDLAIVDRARPGYALAILLDNPQEAVQDSAERYVFRPGILRSFGWRVLDLPGKDWLDDAQGVLARIEAMLGGGDDPALDVQPTEAPPTPRQQTPVPASPDAEDMPAATGDAPALVRALVYQAGGSDKFWRAAVRGAELTVSYGRAGSTGQTLVKAFDSAERAAREMEKLVAEKLRKGYVEAAP